MVSDVHGSVKALSTAGDDADALVCLGDLLLFLDYDDPEQGIFADLFGPAASREYLRLRYEHRYAEARELSVALWARRAEQTGDTRSTREVMGALVQGQYAAIFAAMPTPSYLTPGNVDQPQLWPDFLRPGQHVLDGATVELDGLTFGFVGGGLQTRYRTPNEITDEEFAAKVEAVGAVDVLCCHVPPALPEITYDTAARRFERGSRASLAAVRRTQPRLLLHGHVHNPLVRRTRIGRTEVVNVGHFRATGRPFVLQW